MAGCEHADLLVGLGSPVRYRVKRPRPRHEVGDRLMSSPGGGLSKPWDWRPTDCGAEQNPSPCTSSPARTGRAGPARHVGSCQSRSAEPGDREPAAPRRGAFRKMGPPSQCSRLRECLATRQGRGSTIRARTPRCGRGSRPTLPALTISTGCDGRMGFAVRCVGGRRRGSCQTGGGRAESAGGGCRRRRGRSSTGRGRR